MRILLTGSSGMVGRNFLENNKSKNYEILKPNSSELNLLNSHEINKFFKKNNIDLVIHLAAMVGGIGSNIRNQEKYLLNNNLINTNIISASLKYKIKNFINIGSTCVYPNNLNESISESNFLKGPFEKSNEGYALAKASAISLCNFIDKKKGYNYKNLIPCNMYGKYDKFDNKKSHLIAAIIYKIHNAKKLNRKSVTIWGSGDAKREFMYVGDFVEILFKSIKAIKKIPSMTNIGPGNDLKVVEYYDIVKQVLGWEGKWKFDNSKPQGMKRKLSNNTRMKKLGWKVNTKLVKGLKITYEDFLNFYA